MSSSQDPIWEFRFQATPKAENFGTEFCLPCLDLTGRRVQSPESTLHFALISNFKCLRRCMQHEESRNLTMPAQPHAQTKSSGMPKKSDRKTTFYLKNNTHNRNDTGKQIR